MTQHKLQNQTKDSIRLVLNYLLELERRNEIIIQDTLINSLDDILEQLNRKGNHGR